MREEKLRRLRLKQQTRSPEIEEEWQRCKADVVYWLDTYGYTFDPRLKGQKYIPFKLFPRQSEFLRWLENLETIEAGGLAEKSRDCGLSYLSCGFSLHRWIFVPGYSVGFGSRKEDLVDKTGDPDTLFEKIRIILERLPVWQVPASFSLDKHSSHMKLVNPDSGATITGEAGKNIGRGGRKTIYFVDESAFLEQPDLAERSLSDTTNVRLDISTPNGQGNPFEIKRHSGRVRVFSFHWKDDPRKNKWVVIPDTWMPAKDEEENLILPEEIAASGQLPVQPIDIAKGFKQIFPWYELYKLSHDSVTVAQEADIDYSASIEGICIPAKWVRAAVDYNIAGISATYPLVAGFDVADGGKAESVMVPRRGPNVMDPVGWAEMSAGQAAHRATDVAERMGVESVFYDAIGVGTSVKEVWDNGERKPTFKAIGIKWGDPPTAARWPSGKSSEEMFVNLRAELWWIMRTRFEKTWQVVNEGAAFPPDELISIPNDPKLIAQLSSILHHYTNTGKIQIESKQELSKRGVASPDRADALAYSFAPGKRKGSAA